ncbi:putative TIM-barrel fold metal-dependent hydrolase [Frankia torreyi]|uniref:Putative TIM-barrel fold metal-dependent hydrolase n=2 Tax=Frankia TaxID=1854 RepID=A0A0D8BBH1_9ACTN|nr:MULTISPECIES: amidohydrolase family protein [Frankia]KJE21628.1 putative TIM-barrel fold metal-dependent hydrolase [Frankia torreyi]
MSSEIGGRGGSQADDGPRRGPSRRAAVGLAAVVAGAGTAVVAGAGAAAAAPVTAATTTGTGTTGTGTTEAGTADHARTGATGRIDVHHHAMPAEVRAWLVEHGQLPPVGGPPFANWSLPAALDTMDRGGIATAVLSAAIPSEFTPTPALAAQLARLANDTIADVVRGHPTRFGLLAYVPRATPQIAVAEIRHAYDDLHADGVLLMAHDGVTYLGDPGLEPVMAELNARDAVALVHPFNLPGATGIAVPAFVADFLADTTRAAVQLVVNGVLERYPRIRWILAHGGGYFPYQAARLALTRSLGYGTDLATVDRTLRRFFVDTAGPMSPYSTPSLLAAIGVDRILYGSDYNAVPADTVFAGRDAFLADPALNPAARRTIARDNALALFPTIAARLAAGRR